MLPSPAVPRSLRYWFIAHFIADLVFAVPLLFFTSQFLTTLGFSSDNLLLGRLVGAALVGIGVTSLAMHQANSEIYTTMLLLKLLWSGSAIAAIAISLAEGAPQTVKWFLVVFIVFFVVWLYYTIRLKRYAKSI